MSRMRRLPGPQGLQVNMTPMIDVVFLLIVFFMLVSRIASEEVAQGVDLPEVYGAETDEEMPRINYRYVRAVMERVALAEIEVMHLSIVEEAQ